MILSESVMDVVKSQFFDLEYFFYLFITFIIVSIIKAIIDTKSFKCPICGQTVIMSETVKTNINGALTTICKKCNSKIIARQQKQNFDNFFSSASPTNNSGRRGRYISASTKQAVMARDGGRCVECGSMENIEYDHVIPVSRGGSNTEKNIQLLCSSCNRRKHNKIQ